MAKSSQTPESSTLDWNMDDFHIRQLFKHIHTGLPCQVTDVFPLPPGNAKANRDGIMGLVHVKLAVEQFDNNEPPQCIECNTIYNVPYFRVQAGKAALVIDPIVGDWGWLHFGERDISRWKLTKKIELPPTRRMLTQSDGGYFPGCGNEPPEIWIRIRDDGIFIEGKDQPITVNTEGKIELNSPDIHLKSKGGFDQGGSDFRLKDDKMWLYANEINMRREMNWNEQPPVASSGNRGPTMPE